ncbi:MAG TPA: T9SS type A sorting domain-containing protein [Rubricoccaceae bacterium]|jgi:hypothetical protein
MISFRYAALALLVTAAPAMAQDLQVDFAPYAGTESASPESLVLTDSIYYDSGDNNTTFTIGFGFPGSQTNPGDPGEFRASRYVPAVTYTVPATRTTPFALTGMRLRYRTASVSAFNSAPPRVLYTADANPVYAVFPGSTIPIAQDDSLDAPGAVATGTLPYSTALSAPATQDGYRSPIPQQFFISFIPAGQTTVPAGLIFQPGQSFTIRLQFFNVPYPMSVEAGSSAAFANRSFSLAFTAANPNGIYQTLDLLGYAGPNVADTTTPDGIQDQWFMRALSDNAFAPSAGEDGAANRAVALGQPYPNPASGIVELPFALRDAGAASISVYDVTGREVAVVANQTFASGGQSVQFDASALSAGVYVVVLQANGERSTQRLSVVR